MIYHQNKKGRGYFFYSGIVLWVAAAIVFFDSANALLHRTFIGMAMFFLPDRVVSEKERESSLASLHIGKVESENEKLREALKIVGKYRHVPASVKFGGGYLFSESLFINEGANAGIKKGDAVVAGWNVLIGKISEVGENWSEVERVGSLGTKIIFSAADAAWQGITLEATGIGGGELTAEIPANYGGKFMKIGDALRWGENHDFVIGFVDKIDFKEGGAFQKIKIINPAPLFIGEVKIISENK